jgi:hypothetical protein
MVDHATALASNGSRGSSGPSLTSEQLAFLGSRYALAPGLDDLGGSAYIGRGMASFQDESGGFGEVGFIQSMLRDLGATDNAGRPIEIDGKFWSKSEQASVRMQQQLGIEPANGKWDADGLQRLMMVHSFAQSNPALAASMLGQEAPLAQNAYQRAVSPAAQFAPGLRFNPMTGSLQYTTPTFAGAGPGGAPTAQPQFGAPQNFRPVMLPNGQMIMAAAPEANDGGPPVLESLAGARLNQTHPEWASKIRDSRAFRATQERLETHSTLYNKLRDRVRGEPADYVRQADGKLARQGRLDFGEPEAVEPGPIQAGLGRSKLVNRVRDAVTGDPKGEYIRQTDGTLVKQYGLDFKAKPEPAVVPHQGKLEFGTEEHAGEKVLEATSELAAVGKYGKYIKGASKVVVPLAVGLDAIDLGSSIQKDADRHDGSHIETKKAVGRIAGGWGGAILGGAVAGAAAGAVLGAGVGAVPGFIIGAAGAALFGWMGSKAGEKVAEAV